MRNSLAEERLDGTGITCLLAPGNDDPLFVDDLPGCSDMLVNPEGQLVELPGGLTMISVGYPNPTPWRSPRELPEEQLAARINAGAAKVPDMSRVIFNLHVPPKDAPVNQAMALDEQFRPMAQRRSRG